MSDIEKRLREAHPISQQYANGSKILLEAANEIRDLRQRARDCEGAIQRLEQILAETQSAEIEAANAETVAWAEVDRLTQRGAELEKDARRYQFIRDNQYWHRKEPKFDEPGFDLIGVKFEQDSRFTAKVWLDHAIDQRLLDRADEVEGGE